MADGADDSATAQPSATLPTSVACAFLIPRRSPRSLVSFGEVYGSPGHLAYANRGLALRLLGRQELLDLPHRVVDLHVELILAEFGGRRPGVPRDPVVDPRRIAAPAPPDRVAKRRADELFPDPPLVAAEVEHLGRVDDRRVAARREALRLQVLVEVRHPFRIHVVAVIDVDPLRRVLVVELLRRVTVDVRLAAAVIAHQDDVLEA